MGKWKNKDGKTRPHVQIDSKRIAVDLVGQSR